MLLNRRTGTPFLIARLISIMLVGLVACNDQQAKTAATKKDTVDHHLTHAARDLAGNFSTQTVLTFDSARLTPFFSRYPSLRPF